MGGGGGGGGGSLHGGSCARQLARSCVFNASPVLPPAGPFACPPARLPYPSTHPLPAARFHCSACSRENAAPCNGSDEADSGLDEPLATSTFGRQMQGSGGNTALLASLAGFPAWGGMQPSGSNAAAAIVAAAAAAGLPASQLQSLWCPSSTTAAGSGVVDPAVAVAAQMFGFGGLLGGLSGGSLQALPTSGAAGATITPPSVHLQGLPPQQPQQQQQQPVAQAGPAAVKQEQLQQQVVARRNACGNGSSGDEQAAPAAPAGQGRMRFDDGGEGALISLGSILVSPCPVPGRPACVRACVRAWVRGCVRGCVHARRLLPEQRHARLHPFCPSLALSALAAGSGSGNGNGSSMNGSVHPHGAGGTGERERERERAGCTRRHANLL